ncbi:NrsF family protein, partial [Rhizobium laguerreae]|uniref:NrsF family protein n=1 Tax=Rhizobium laguerreae TaxID=1076926 RepID=UPI0021B0F27B
LTKIIGKRSRHSMLASTPASILNHKTSKNGIPADSTKSGYALAPAVFLFLVMRHGAPDHPGQAGAIAALASAGIAATLYASNCPDDSPLFVATWYPIAILIVAAAGYFAGRRFLRW